MTDEDHPVRRRRRRGGFSGGSGLSNSSHAEGAQLDAEDDGLDPDLNERVMETARHEAAESLPEQDLVDPVTDMAEEFTPQGRMREVGKRSSKYEKEYRLKLLHRMLLRNVPLDKIANELGISISQVRRDRATLYKRVREEAKHLDVNHLIGDSVGFYNEVMSMALRAASVSKTPLNMRLAAMRTSLSAKNDMHRFLQAAGVYDVLRYRAAEEGADNDDISKMVKMTKMILEMDEDEELPQELAKEMSRDELGMADLDDEDEEEDDIRLIY